MLYAHEKWSAAVYMQEIMSASLPLPGATTLVRLRLARRSAYPPTPRGLALNRLARQNMIAQPARGFYVIVPPEYRSLECLPADQFVPELMQRLVQPYYAGLLSAAQYHGAAHHRPQEFQVLLDKARRPIHCGRVRVTFIVRKRLENVPVQIFNTPRGMIRVSTPEATAVDLVGYCRHVGGLEQVATILSELAEQIDPQKTGDGPHRLRRSRGHNGLDTCSRLSITTNRLPLLKTYVKNEARATISLLPRRIRAKKRLETWTGSSSSTPTSSRSYDPTRLYHRVEDASTLGARFPGRARPCHQPGANRDFHPPGSEKCIGINPFFKAD